jgi:acyl-coenzyme A thioesterase PaaI-like protein
MTDVSERVDRVRTRYEGCFGCGRANAIGLQLDRFESDGEVVSASFVPRAEYRGFDGILHGGIVAAALDEVLGWTAILLEGSTALTAKLELRYRRPAPADARYRLEGRVVERRGKRLILEGVCAVDGSTIAEATGVFLINSSVDDA